MIWLLACTSEPVDTALDFVADGTGGPSVTEPDGPEPGHEGRDEGEPASLPLGAARGSFNGARPGGPGARRAGGQEGRGPGA